MFPAEDSDLNSFLHSSCRKKSDIRYQVLPSAFSIHAPLLQRKAAKDIYSSLVKAEVKTEPVDDGTNKELFPDAQVDDSPRYPPETLGDTQPAGTMNGESDTVPGEFPHGPSEVSPTQKDMTEDHGAPNMPDQQEPPTPPAAPSAPAQPSVPASDLAKGSSVGKGRGGVKRRVAEDSEFWVASTPPPVLSEKAIDSRLRRVFTPRADGSKLLDDSWLHQWQDRHEGRSKVMELFEKVGYNVDMGCQKRGHG